MRDKNKTGEKLVVIGNGMAGTACLEEIYKLGPSRFDVTVFGAERHNYNRVLLAQVLTGEKSLNDITLHNKAWYEERGIKLHTGEKVVEIKRKSRKAVTESGLEVPYDKLIFATGALPLMPPIPGMDKEGILPFRNMDDCHRIVALARAGGKAAVIGGGLLGLEAAWALKRLGMEVTLIHLMDKLMERQLDSLASAFLKDDIEKAGISVLLNKETREFSGNGRVEGLDFKDGSSIPADLAVISIGIRPNAVLAASSGIYCRKGIVVSDCMQTYDPAVFAIGECVEHRNTTFGLVGPIFEQARVVANHLAGDGRLVFKPQPASTRLKIPGIELYSAGEINSKTGADSADSIEYLDKGARTYKRLVIDEGRLKGIILYGDTSDGPRLFSSLLDGEDISGKRSALLLGGGAQPGAPSIEAIPDNAIVCGCNGVTKKMIVDAIEKKGLFTREDVVKETKASGSCGGCAGVVDRILESTLGSNFQSKAKAANLCECTKYTRDDVIKNIKEKGLKSVRDVMDTLGWETVGCSTCRPALNYYVSLVWPDGSEDDITSRLVNERSHANIQKDGTFSVVPRMYGGIADPAELKRIAEAALKYEVPLVKITGGQRIALIGVKKDDLEEVWKDLDMPSGYAYAKALRTVKTCVGSGYCRFGTQDSLGFGIELEKYFEGLWMPAKVKMGVSGCPRSCAESSIKDIGVIGVTGAWDIYAGGCGGIELKGGEKLCTVKTEEEALDIIAAFVQLYREEAHYGERTFKWIGRMGMGALRKAVVEDVENRGRLKERLDKAREKAADPWEAKVSSSGKQGGRRVLH
ncbi:MAG: NAD(P)/FAD-dependent oxidoreductase [Deltaproteobacteria bacterium]|nr:NAD(P)/FAD-dependent oxidoreductase [Deltaproteobacteria bacterium]